MARAQRMKHWRFLYSLNLVRDMLLRLRGQRPGFDSTYWSQGGLGQVFTGTGDCARILFFKMRPALAELSQVIAKKANFSTTPLRNPA
jgi:hypothetical protein